MGVFKRVQCPKCKKNYDIRKEKKKVKDCKCGHSIKLDTKNAIYYIDYYVENERIREKVGISKTLAENALRKKQIEIAEGKFLDKRKLKKIKFNDFVDEYIEIYLKHNRSWPKADACNIKCLKSFFGGKYLYEINQMTVEKFKTERSEQVSPAGVNRALARLKSIYNKAIVWGKFDGKNPVKGVKFLTENNKRLRYLEKEEISRLLNNCEAHLKPIVITALNTGMRKGEILNLKWQDVDFRRNIIHIYKTKNNEKREIPMNEMVKTALVKVRKNPNSPYIFNRFNDKPYLNVRKSFFTALKKSGIIDFRFHDLRHTFASQLVMSGVDLNTVRELLGHKTLDMTLRYSHLSPDHKKRAVAILNTHLDTSKTPRSKTQEAFEAASLEVLVNT